MADLIPDEILETVAVCGEPEAVSAAILNRYAKISDRISLPAYPSDPETWARVVASLRRLS